MLAFFEDLGTAHDKELVDRDVVLLSFGNAPAQIFMEAWWYIAWERGGGLGSDTKLHLEFEKHVRWLIDAEAEFAEMKPNLAARLIVLPAGARESGWGTWQLCRDLSNALSVYPAPADTHVAVVTAAVQEIVGAAADEEAESLFGEVIPVPPGLDVEPDAWSDEREQAARLERMLAGRDAHAIARLVAQLNDAAAELRDASGEPDVPEAEREPEHAHGGH